MGISDALHARRQDADRQQSPGARYQNLCHWQKELAVQRHRRGSQGQCRRLQSDADLPRLTRRAVSLVAPRPHRIASARGRRRYYRPAALQLPQNRRCLNGSDAALDTKAIRQKRGRHRAEKIALTIDERVQSPQLFKRHAFKRLSFHESPPTHGLSVAWGYEGKLATS